MDFTALKQDMIARGLVIMADEVKMNSVTLPEDQGTLIIRDVPCIKTTLSGFEIKTVQPVFIYNAGNAAGHAKPERAEYADRIIENEVEPTVEPTKLEVARDQLLDLIVLGTTLPELGGASIAAYEVIDGKEIGGENAVKLKLTLSSGGTPLVWATRTAAGDLKLDPAV